MKRLYARFVLWLLKPVLSAHRAECDRVLIEVRRVRSAIERTGVNRWL